MTAMGYVLIVCAFALLMIGVQLAFGCDYDDYYDDEDDAE